VPVFKLNQLCSAIHIAPLLCRHCAGERVRRREPARTHAARAVSRRAVGLQTRLQSSEQCARKAAHCRCGASSPRKGALGSTHSAKKVKFTGLT
jgi:hypothetical protein